MTLSNDMSTVWAFHIALRIEFETENRSKTREKLLLWGRKKAGEMEFWEIASCVGEETFL